MKMIQMSLTIPRSHINVLSFVEILLVYQKVFNNYHVYKYQSEVDLEECTIYQYPVDNSSNKANSYQCVKHFIFIYIIVLQLNVIAADCILVCTVFTHKRLLFYLYLLKLLGELASQCFKLLSVMDMLL